MQGDSGTGDDMTSIRARVVAAGLELDEERLASLARALPGVEAMIATMELVEIDPLDLALEPFDPAWPAEGRAR